MARFRSLAPTLLLLGAGCFDLAGPPEVPPPRGLEPAVAAAEHALAAEAGARVLRDGGTAIDAAAAMQFALTVVEPMMSGIGGGTFLLYREAATGEITFWDGREMAPAASTPDQFLHPGGVEQSDDYAQRQGYAVGVPGTVKLFDEALARYGKQSLAQVLQPAIELARDGFPVGSYLAWAIEASKDKLESWPASARIFLHDSACVGDDVGCAGGRPYAEGETLQQADLARTLRLIAEAGAGVFYEGEIADAIVAAQAQRDGRMTTHDLARYVVKAREPTRWAYGDYELVSAPPPSSGGLTMGQLLLLLEPFDLSASGVNSADSLHLMIEAMHLAYADRAAYIGDSDFVGVPATGLLHPDYVAERRALIDPARANPFVEAGDPWPYEPGSRPAPREGSATDHGWHTSHFVVVDHWGNVATVTTTLEDVFGSGMVVPGYGFVLNSQLTDFDFTPGGPNQVEPGKRPRSSMAPTFVLQDGNVVAALGSPGGSRIITTVLQVVLNLIEHGMDVDAAVDAARIHSSTWPDVLVEAGIESETRLALIQRGHSVSLVEDAGLGLVQALERQGEGAWVGVADGRIDDGGVVVVPPP